MKAPIHLVLRLSAPLMARSGLWPLLFQQLGVAWPLLVRLLALGSVAAFCILPAAGFAAGGAQAVATQVQPAVVTVATKRSGQEEALSSGSGFFVGDQGRVVTNYHVVAQFLRKPKAFALEVELAGGRKTAAQVLAFDVVDDLAVLKVEAAPSPLRTVRLPKGDDPPATGAPLHAFGNASALGVVQTRGHFSGMYSKLGFERMQFTGTLNPGMSGGPAVNGQGLLVGVNVSRGAGAEQQAFLVPLARVRALLARAGPAPLGLEAANLEIRRQLLDFQAQAVKLSLQQPAPFKPYGPYLAAEFGGDQLMCSPISGGQDIKDTDVVVRQGRSCRMPRSIDIGDGLTVGLLTYSHLHVRSLKLGDMRFNAYLDRQFRNRAASSADGDMAQAHCTVGITMAGPHQKLPARIEWCAQAYPDFEGLYDVYIRLVSRDRPNEALVSAMNLVGVSWETAGLYTRRLLETMQ